MAKVEPLGIGFPQKYNEPTGQIQSLDPAHVVDLVTPAEAGKVARAAAKPAKTDKVGKKARKGKK